MPGAVPGALDGPFDDEADQAGARDVSKQGDESDDGEVTPMITEPVAPCRKILLVFAHVHMW